MRRIRPGLILEPPAATVKHEVRTAQRSGLRWNDRWNLFAHPLRRGGVSYTGSVICRIDQV
jgi:hypothetical protein